MICKECGGYNSDRARFCRVCGASLLLEEASDSVESESAAPAVTWEADAEEPGTDAIREKETVTTRFSKKSASRPVIDNEDDEDEDEDEEPVSRSFRSKSTASHKGTRFSSKDSDEDDAEVEDDEDDIEEKPALKKKSRDIIRTSKSSAKYDDDDEDEDDEDDEVEAEEVNTRKSTRKHSSKYIRDEEEDDDDYDDEDDEEFEDDEDELDEDEDDAQVYVSKKHSSEYRRSSKRRIDDDDEDDEDDDDDDDDDYEEYESTPPRKKKKSSGGNSNLLIVLLAAIAVILVLIIGIVVFCNVNADYRHKLPAFLQFEACAPEEASVPELPEAEENPQQEYLETAEATSEPEPDQEYVVDNIDYTVASMEETVNDKGMECIKVKFFLLPGETMTAVLPNQDDMVYTNSNENYLDFGLEIPKDCYKPNAPLTSAEYEVKPIITVTGVDGTVTTKDVGSFVMTFPDATLEITEPSVIPAEGIMCPEGNVLHIEGLTNDHTVTVMANDQKLNVYEGGKINSDYVLTGDTAEEVTITVSGDNLVTTAHTITVLPYVFIPEPMELSVDGEAKDHKAVTKTGKVTLTGKVSPGSEMTASCDYEDIKCGSVLVNADGSFSLEVTYGSTTYGMFPIHLHSVQEGYEEGNIDAYVYRMFDDRKAFVNGYQKTKDYKELPAGISYEQMLADPGAYGGYRVTGTVDSVEEVNGLQVVKMSVQISSKERKTMYVINMSSSWNPAKNTDSACKVYCTLNGLYSDGESLSLIGWFVL